MPSTPHDYGGEQVVVRYDIHDPARVWVWDNEDRRQCRLSTRQRAIIEAEAAAPVQVAPEHIELPAETIEYRQRVIELQAKKAAAPFNWSYPDNVFPTMLEIFQNSTVTGDSLTVFEAFLTDAKWVNFGRRLNRHCFLRHSGAA